MTAPSSSTGDPAASRTASSTAPARSGPATERSSHLPATLLPALCVLIVFGAFFVGQFPLGLDDFLTSARHWFLEGGQAAPTAVDKVLWQIRLPRILAGVFVGASLSVAGAAYQGMFRNPLVSPDILGITAGAGLGAMLAIYLGQPVIVIQLAAFCSGLLTVGLVCLVSQAARFHSPTLALVLSGIAIGALCGAGISLAKILADPYRDLPSMTFWMLGALNSVTLDDLLPTLPVMLAGMLPLALLRWRMNLLSLDDEEAQALGVNVRRTRLLFILSATLMTSASVAITGIIGWVGLVIPHIARLWVGPDFRRLLPASLCLGAGFLVLTDTVARTLFPIEVPLGIITACIGAPFFLGLLIRTGDRR